MVIFMVYLVGYIDSSIAILISKLINILTQICCITFIYKCFNCCKTLLNDLYVPDQDASDGIQTEETDDKETVM